MRSIEPGIHNPHPWLWIPGLRYFRTTTFVVMGPRLRGDDDGGEVTMVSSVSGQPGLGQLD